MLKSKSPCILLSKNIECNKWNQIENEKSLTVLERQPLCFSSYRNCKLKVKLMSWSLQKKKRAFLYRFFCPKNVFQHFCFISSVLNALSEYTYFYISKNITSFTFLCIFKVVKSLQCILKLAAFSQWAKGSKEAASVGPAVLHICFCSLSNNSK